MSSYFLILFLLNLYFVPLIGNTTPRLSCQGSMARGKVLENTEPSSKNEARVSVPKRKIKEEIKQLKTQGIRPVFYRGMEEVYKMMATAFHLRKPNVSMYAFHIKDFAKQALQHIAFMRKGLNDRLKKSEEEGSNESAFWLKKRLALLNEFEKEALQKQRGGATYLWWVGFNKRLSLLGYISQTSDYHAWPPELLTSPTVKMNIGDHLIFYKRNGVYSIDFNWWKTEEGFNKVLFDHVPEAGAEISLTRRIINNFPNVIFLPTIKDLDIIPINDLISKGIRPGNLSAKRLKMVDGERHNSKKVFWHDEQHAVEYIAYLEKRLQTGLGIPKDTSAEFRDSLNEKTKELPARQKEQIETVYFLLNYELLLGRTEETLELGYKHREVKERSAVSYLQAIDDLGFLLPKDINPHSKESVENYLNESKNLYWQTIESL